MTLNGRICLTHFITLVINSVGKSSDDNASSCCDIYITGPSEGGGGAGDWTCNIITASPHLMSQMVTGLFPR